jgi:lipopolysaccharide biosynthesis glycosyltransferase
MTKIPVVFSTDDNYAPYCATAIASVLKNSEPSTEFEFYILTANLSKEIQYKFNALTKIKNCSINFIYVKQDEFKDCPVWDYTSFNNLLISTRYYI